MPFLASFPGSAVVQRTLTDAQNGAASFTVSLGAAFSSRIIVVAVTYAGTAASSVTLGGTPMTAIVTPATGGGRCAIYDLAFPTGTSASLVLTGASTISSVSVYSLSGLASPTAFATVGGATRPLSLNVPTNGVCIASCYSNNASTGYTFSGVANDNTYNSGSSGGAQGSAEFATAQTPLSVNFTSSGATFGLAAASWGP